MAKEDSESESGKVELIVSRFFSKCIHVILESRCTTYNNAAVRKVVNSDKDRWFSLLLRDLPPELIRNTTGVCPSTQLVVDLVLLQRSGNGVLHSRAGSSWDRKAGKVIERWAMMFDVNKGIRDNARRLRGSSTPKTFYKKCILVMRSLYLMVKLLPAYKLFRNLTASREPCEFCIGHHISSFTEPLTRDEEAQMQKYFFDPVETPFGSLGLSVLYLSSLVDIGIEPSYQMFPHIIIPDYCGGVSVNPDWASPRLPSNGMLTIESKTSGIGRKSSLANEIGIRAHAPLPTALRTNSASRETSGEEPKTAVFAKRQWPTAQAATSPSCNRSHSLDAPSHPAKTSRHAPWGSGSLHYLRSEDGLWHNLEELGDAFHPRLSDNAALGSMFSIFQSAAPLRRSSASSPNNTELQSTSIIVPAKQTVKTTLDALRELQDHIELKNRILQRRPTRTPPYIVSLSAAIKSSVVNDSTPVSE